MGLIIQGPEVQDRLLQKVDSFEDMLAQYDSKYQAILGVLEITSSKYDDIISVLLHGNLYAGSDGSDKYWEAEHKR